MSSTSETWDQIAGWCPMCGPRATTRMKPSTKPRNWFCSLCLNVFYIEVVANRDIPSPSGDLADEQRIPDSNDPSPASAAGSGRKRDRKAQPAGDQGTVQHD